MRAHVALSQLGLLQNLDPNETALGVEVEDEPIERGHLAFERVGVQWDAGLNDPSLLVPPPGSG
jgi:hypothetical protein